MPFCTLCSSNLPASRFSYNQLRFKEDKKCKICIREMQGQHQGARLLRAIDHYHYNDDDDDDQQQTAEVVSASLFRALESVLGIRHYAGTQPNDREQQQQQQQHQQQQERQQELRRRERNRERRRQEDAAARNPRRSTKNTDFLSDILLTQHHHDQSINKKSSNRPNNHFNNNNNTNSAKSSKGGDCDSSALATLMECPVCYEEMSLESDCHFRCVVLKCAHTICFSCYAKIKRNTRRRGGSSESPSSGDDNDDDDGDDNHVNSRLVTDLRCPICREEFIEICEVPRIFKSAIQFVQRFGAEKMNTLTGNAANNRSSALAASTSTTTQQQQHQQQHQHNPPTHDHYDRLANFTTGTIRKLKSSPPMGEVELDETNEVLWFCSATSPRFMELREGMYVKLQVVDSSGGPSRAIGVAPLDDHVVAGQGNYYDHPQHYVQNNNSRFWS